MNNDSTGDSLRLGRLLTGAGILLLLITFVAAIVWMSGLRPDDDDLLAPGVAPTSAAEAAPAPAPAAEAPPAAERRSEDVAPYPAGGKLAVPTDDASPAKSGPESRFGDL